MQIRFISSRPADAAALVLPVGKAGIAALGDAGLESAAAALVRGAAEGARFDGEPGTIAEIFVPQGDGAARVILLGTGSGSEADLERAGGALTARFLTAGIPALVIDFSTLSATSAATAVARLLAAAEQRSWRHDIYRTRLPASARPTLERIEVVDAPDGIDAAWTDAKALTDGLALTRTLVSEPPNVLYPESFVERCRHLEELGVEITVLDRFVRDQFEG